MNNQIRLSPTEQRIADLIAAGMTDMQIAARLGMNYYTVRFHVRNIHNKAGTNRRTVLALEYSRCCSKAAG